MDAHQACESQAEYAPKPSNSMGLEMTAIDCCEGLPVEVYQPAAPDAGFVPKWARGLSESQFREFAKHDVPEAGQREMVDSQDAGDYMQPLPIADGQTTDTKRTENGHARACDKAKLFDVVSIGGRAYAIPNWGARTQSGQESGHCVLMDVPKGSLPTSPAERKAIPLCTGLLDYFPKALAAVAECSRVGNDQHNPGEKLHWAREKSTDQADCIVRHLIERGAVDTDGVRHSAKVAWRALALLELEIEAGQ